MRDRVVSAARAGAPVEPPSSWALQHGQCIVEPQNDAAGYDGPRAQHPRELGHGSHFLGSREPGRTPAATPGTGTPPMKTHWSRPPGRRGMTRPPARSRRASRPRERTPARDGPRRPLHAIPPQASEGFRRALRNDTVTLRLADPVDPALGRRGSYSRCSSIREHRACSSGSRRAGPPASTGRGARAPAPCAAGPREAPRPAGGRERAPGGARASSAPSDNGRADRLQRPAVRPEGADRLARGRRR